MYLRIVSLLAFALCIIAAACASPQTGAGGSAAIEIVSETDTSLSVKFTDASGASQTLAFSRGAAGETWRVDEPAGRIPGVVFGKAELKFASLTAQRHKGVSPSQALQTFGSSIATSTFDDVTVVRLGTGDTTVALWQNDEITEIWWVGSLVKEIMAPIFIGWDFCERLNQLCCRTVPNPDPGLGEPVDIPKPNVASCRIAAENCGDAAKQAACDCLNTACNFCFDHPDYCTGPDDPDFPWLPQASEDSCNAGGEVCVDPPDPDPDPDPDPVDKIFDEVGSRLQVQVDIQNAKAME